MVAWRRGLGLFGKTEELARRLEPEVAVRRLVLHETVGGVIEQLNTWKRARSVPISVNRLPSPPALRGAGGSFGRAWA